MSLPNFSNLRADSQDGIFFARELEQIKSKTYDVKYPELRARQFVPASSEPASPGEKVITYRQFDRKGIAKIIDSYAMDLPRADVQGVEFSSYIREVGSSYGYNLSEIEAAAKAGRPLPAMRAAAARRAIDELIDNLIANGDSANQLVGFLNQSAVPQASVATVSGATTFAEKLALDPDLVADDINDMLSDMIELTKGEEEADTVLMPPSQLARLKRTRLVDQNMTVLAFLQSVNPGVTFDHWYRLTGAGDSSTDRMVAYKRSAEKVFYEVPLEFQQLDPQERGLEFVINCRASCGGVICPYPLSMSYRDGI